MDLLQIFTRRKDYQTIRETIGRIAARQRAAVLDRISGQVFDMSENEARGYVRARTATIVQSEVSNVLRENKRLRSYQQQLIRLSSETLVEQGIADVDARRHESRRAA